MINRENQIQEYDKKKLLEEMSKMPTSIVATAYLYAINYTWFDEDVTVKWTTATQNASALAKAYERGFYDALQKQAESEDKE